MSPRELRSGPIVIGQDQIDRFWAPMNPGAQLTSSIHTSHERAVASGLSSTIVEGRLALALLSGLLQDTFGERWLRGGSVSAKFIGQMPVGVRLLVCADQVDGEPGLETYDVWCETVPEATKVLVGTATVPAGGHDG